MLVLFAVMPVLARNVYDFVVGRVAERTSLLLVIVLRLVLWRDSNTTATAGLEMCSNDHGVDTRRQDGRNCRTVLDSYNERVGRS